MVIKNLSKKLIKISKKISNWKDCGMVSRFVYQVKKFNKKKIYLKVINYIRICKIFNKLLDILNLFFPTVTSSYLLASTGWLQLLLIGWIISLYVLGLLYDDGSQPEHPFDIVDKGKEEKKFPFPPPPRRPNEPEEKEEEEPDPDIDD